MDIFRSRLPSRRDVTLLFAVCVVPVYVWTILNLLQELPAWLLRLTTWELIGVIAYILAFALLESIVVLLILTTLSVILPGRLLRDRLVAQGSMAVLVTACWAILAHYNDEVIRLWGLRQFLLWGVVYAVSIGVLYVLIDRWQKLQGLLRSLAERLTVLSFVYVFVGLLGVVIVIIRNIQGST